MWSEGGVESSPKGDGVAKKTLQGQFCSDKSIGHWDSYYWPFLMIGQS